MEASIQGQITVPPHTNSLAFFFLSCVCVCSAGVSAKVGRDEWLCLEGKREGDREGEKGTDIQRNSPMGLSWLLFHCVTPFFPLPPFPLFHIPLSIRCHLFLGSDEDVCCSRNTCFTNFMNLVACVRNNKASVERERERAVIYLFILFSFCVVCSGYFTNLTFYFTFWPSVDFYFKSSAVVM